MDKSGSKRGMNIGKGMTKLSQKTGITVKRNPHATGTPGKQGSARKQTHDKGNQQAITAVKGKIKQKLGATVFQSSQQRTMAKQEKKKLGPPVLTKKELALEQLGKRFKNTKKVQSLWEGGNPNHW